MREPEDLVKEVADRQAHQHSAQASHHQMEQLTKAISGLKLEMPETQQLEWKVSLKGIKELLTGLDLTISQITKLIDQLPQLSDNFSKTNETQSKELAAVTQAIKAIKIPEVKLPPPVKEVTVSNLNELKKPLADLASKLKLELPDIQIPAYPDKVTINNLNKVETFLSEIFEAIKALESKELPTTDVASVVEAVKSVKRSVDDIIFPVPQFNIPKTPEQNVAVDIIGGASSETSSIYDGLTALTPKFAKIAASSSGNNALVTAVTSKKIRVLSYNFIANGTVNAKFQSDGGGTPTDLTGLKYCIANMGISVNFSPIGHFETASGKSLDINLSTGVAIGGELTYVEV